MTELLTQYAGYVFVAHRAALDKRALSEALRQWLGCAPKFNFLDTLQIERNRLTRSGQEQASGQLRLPQCLRRHNLPAGAQHHALEDVRYYCCRKLARQAGIKWRCRTYNGCRVDLKRRMLPRLSVVRKY